MNICVKCEHHVGRPGHLGFGDHLCGNPELECPGRISPVTGEIVYDTPTGRYPKCEDINLHGRCPMFREQKA